MSYSRWSNSCWYSFYCVGDLFALWGFEKDKNWKPEEAKELTEQKIIDYYGCTPEEAREAMEYVAEFNAHYAEKDD